MDFEKFDKIPRLSRDIVITEKIDGTNAQVYIVKKLSLLVDYDIDTMTGIKTFCEEEFIKKYSLYETEDYFMFAGSRKKWLDISSKGDNFQFAKWVEANAKELLKLGEGRHYGEYYGKGIQRNYGLEEKRFALFNVGKWADHNEPIEVLDKRVYPPKCCYIVPVLYKGMFDTATIQIQLDLLANCGSRVAEGFKNPEGIVIYHTASGKLFKKTIYDDQGKNEKDKICS